MNKHSLYLVGLSALLTTGCGDSSSSEDSSLKEYSQRYQLDAHTKVSSSDDLEGIWVGVLNTKTSIPEFNATVDKTTKSVFTVFSLMSEEHGEEKLYFTECGGSTRELNVNEMLFNVRLNRLVSVENNDTMLLEDILGTQWTAIKVSNTAKPLGEAKYSWANASQGNTTEQILATCFNYTVTTSMSGPKYDQDQALYFTYSDLESSIDKYDDTVIDVHSDSSDTPELHVNYGLDSTFDDFSAYVDEGDTVILTESVRELQRLMATYTGANSTSGESVNITIEIEY